jgi:peptide/nickel transport system permease protein
VLVLLTTATATFAAPWLPISDPNEQDLGARLSPPGLLEGKGLHPILGTDHLGRDLFSRVIHGARVSIIVAVVSVTISAFLGAGIGVLSGFVGGEVDRVVMLITDVWLSFPFFFFALAIVAVLGPGMTNLIIAFSVTGWVGYCRIARASTLSLREEVFVDAARALGARGFRIMYRHILPNITAPLIVLMSFEMARVIVREGSLSFLGLGIQPPLISWGSVISDGRQYIQGAWWISIFPGVAMMMNVLAVNLIGDGLRDVLEPGSTKGKYV